MPDAYPLRGTAVGAAEDARRVASFTRRELQALRPGGEGLSNAEIAALLVIAESTAKTHVTRVQAKTGARDRAQAVVVAYRSGVMTARQPSRPHRSGSSPPWPGRSGMSRMTRMLRMSCLRRSTRG